MTDSRRGFLRLAALASMLPLSGPLAAAPASGSSAATTTRAARSVAARQAYITGKPPRIVPIDPASYKPGELETFNEQRARAGRPRVDRLPEYIATTMKAPELMARHTALAFYFYNGALPAFERELVIVRVGWLCQAPYLYGEHVKILKATTGMTATDIRRIRAGSAAPGWKSHERALLKATEELLTDAMITDATWAALTRTLEEKQLIELPLLVAQYQGYAYLQNSLRIRLQDGNPGLLG